MSGFSHSRSSRKKKFLMVGFLVFAVSAVVFIQPAAAISEWLEKLYSNYQIYFYNEEQNCVQSDDDDADKGSKSWDGHCSNVDSYGDRIEKYFDTIYAVAKNNGLPWEGIVAQLIGESSFMSKEVCPFNPLGLKGSPSCDGKHKTFSSYDQAFSYYVNSIKPVRMAMGKFPNDPYGYIEFLINGVPGYKYATDPDYINKISGHVCGIQKWAKAHGKPVSGSGSGGGSGGPTTVGGNNIDKPYCKNDDDDDKRWDVSDFIFYNQCDPKWKNYAYGPEGIKGSTSLGTICNSGCGPTSFAVIAANLKKDKSITPAETADLAGKAGLHVSGIGSSWRITSYLAGQYGLSAKQISGTVATINEYLDNGYMIHTSGKGGAPFTTNGHYIAIVKKLSNGKWLVADSSSRGPSGEYDPATVMKGMNTNNVWAVK